MIPTDLPNQFKRLQFPIQLGFAITISKAQGQSLERCGVHLNVGCFSHGQLYVACSRADKPENLIICTDNGIAKNVVYPQVLRSQKLEPCILIALRGEFRLAPQREITKRKRVNLSQEQRKAWLVAERESKKRIRIEKLQEYIRRITSVVSASFTQLKISTLHTCCWGTFGKEI